jgi:hypothetical protein
MSNSVIQYSISRQCGRYSLKMTSDDSPTLEHAIDIAHDGADDPGWSDADVETLKIELTELRTAHERESRASRPIFSGDYSRDMWAEIGSADNVDEVSHALHTVCCRLQELEARLTQEKWIPYVERLRQRKRALDDTGEHYVSGIPLARLEIHYKDESIRHVELPAGRMTIGRLSTNDLTIPSKVISGHHAQIVTDLQLSLLEDLNSSNGVYVGSKRVRARKLIDGDIFTVGRHKILYRSLRGKIAIPDQKEKNTDDTS